MIEEYKEYHKIFTCEACNTYLSYFSNLNKHIETCEHYENFLVEYKPFYVNCNICYKVFSNQKDCDDHENKCKK